VDEIARAYAVLGVRPGVSLPELRRRYKALVRQWHPDRFAADPVGQAEAATTMRQINDAYRTLLGHAVAHQQQQAPDTKSQARPPHGRLSQEEVDKIVKSIGTNGPVDYLLSSFDGGPRDRAIFWGIGLLLGVVSVWTNVDFRWLAWLVFGIAAFVLWRRDLFD
jgi:DnaJ-class molecular chaperone